MITRLRLQRFKSFEDATLEVGPFSLLVGTNASGKSNLRDAFRFLQGIGRGYTLAEIIGGKYIDGVKVWSGIRGGTRGLTFRGAETFALEVDFTIPDPDDDGKTREAFYRIKVNPGTGGEKPCIADERLYVTGYNYPLIRMSPADQPPEPFAVMVIWKNITRDLEQRLKVDNFLKQQPVLSQFVHRDDMDPFTQRIVRSCLDILKSMRFLEPDPDAMREPSLPGQTTLSDRGENLASVLHHICSDPEQKQELATWMRILTPMDVHDLAFETDFMGRILLNLVEADKHETPAHNASDGTLRFLAMLAALLGPEPSRLFFFEELENGIHPTRLHLLLSLIEHAAADDQVQVVATTHSPDLLLRVHAETLEYASLTYRLESRPDTRIQRILEIPDARHLVTEQDIARLHRSGWFEDMMEFLQDDDEDDDMEVPDSLDGDEEDAVGSLKDHEQTL